MSHHHHHHHQSLFIHEIVSFYMVFLRIVFKTRLKYSKELLTIMLKIQNLTLWIIRVDDHSLVTGHNQNFTTFKLVPRVPHLPEVVHPSVLFHKTRGGEGRLFEGCPNWRGSANSRIYGMCLDTDLAPPNKFSRGECRHLHVRPWALFRVLCNISDFRVSKKLIVDCSG